MNPEKIEKAPEGFTRKLMGRIEVEAPPVKKSFRIGGMQRIPAIAAAIAACLVIFSVLSGKPESSLSMALNEKLNFLSFSIPEMSKIKLPELYVPQIVVYLSVGLLVLWLLDLSLNRLFNRSGN